jgi:lactoylglutathione lyase
MMISKIDATVLFVRDLATCTAFYRDTLGLGIKFSDDVSVLFDLEGVDFLILEAPAAADMMTEEAIAFDRAKGYRVLLCAGVENVDQVYERLAEKGVTFIKPPKDQAWGRRTAYFADPEGNLWELFHEL